MERKWSQAVIGCGENKGKKQQRKFDKWEIPARYKKKKNYHDSGQTQEQAALRGQRMSIPEDSKSLTIQDPD